MPIPAGGEIVGVIRAVQFLMIRWNWSGQLMVAATALPRPYRDNAGDEDVWSGITEARKKREFTQKEVASRLQREDARLAVR